MQRFLISAAITILVLILSGDAGFMPSRNQARTGEGFLIISTGHCRVWTTSAIDGEIALWNGRCDDLGFATGTGTLKLQRPDGTSIESYTGEFHIGAINGRGSWQSADGYYIGSFKDGEKDGKGELNLRGERYVGMFRADRRFGLGEMTWSNGETYRGRWLNDMPDGYGEGFIHGVHFAGQWRQGCLLDNPTVGAGMPDAECAKHSPRLTVYTADELSQMQREEKMGL